MIKFSKIVTYLHVLVIRVWAWSFIFGFFLVFLFIRHGQDLIKLNLINYFDCLWKFSDFWSLDCSIWNLMERYSKRLILGDWKTWNITVFLKNPFEQDAGAKRHNSKVKIWLKDKLVTIKDHQQQPINLFHYFTLRNTIQKISH